MVDHTVILNFIENILCQFESCFSCKASFHWFVVITIGLLLCSNKLDVISKIHSLAFNPGCYDSLLHSPGHPPGLWRTSGDTGPLLSGNICLFIWKGTPYLCRERGEAVQGRTHLSLPLPMWCRW